MVAGSPYPERADSILYHDKSETWRKQAGDIPNGQSQSSPPGLNYFLTHIRHKPLTSQNDLPHTFAADTLGV